MWSCEMPVAHQHASAAVGQCGEGVAAVRVGQLRTTRVSEAIAAASASVGARNTAQGKRGNVRQREPM